MLLRFDPFRELDRVATESRGISHHPLPMDAIRRGNHVVVHFDVPGITVDDVAVTVERNMLTVEATRPNNVGEDDDVIIGERRAGTFRRQLVLGETLDPNRVEADVTDGVLTLRVPIAETAKPRTIEVRSGTPETAGAISA